jgi:hypothetical protein
MTAALDSGHPLFEISAESMTAWAAAMTAFIAFVAALAAFRQLREMRDGSKLADARESYRSYLTLAVEYPELASVKSYADIKADYLKNERYQWFIAYLLAAGEKILDAVGNDPDWIATVKLNLGYNKEYLSNFDYFTDAQLNCYDQPLRKLVYEMTGRCLQKDQKDCERGWKLDNVIEQRPFEVPKDESGKGSS